MSALCDFECVIAQSEWDEQENEISGPFQVRQCTKKNCNADKVAKGYVRLSVICGVYGGGAGESAAHLPSRRAERPGTATD